ncbi:protein MIZU-KUSSEI 1-like [Cucurbita maxima]|uniref:Protein MIZU-KUSSEI 1-like n=1 Tax=Cucurbita maxima TaxID=3661 RepID=A0A6J1IXC6_CUCMA|nr:protein MIZU-KUSSEI 1-like [Cucurbita maxima]
MLNHPVKNNLPLRPIHGQLRLPLPTRSHLQALHCPLIFVIELPMQTVVLNKKMASHIVRIALESETKRNKKKVMEELVWAVYCNGRKVGYSFRRKHMSDDEVRVMQQLRGVSMGAGVLPSPPSDKDGKLTYMRARFERVVGSQDSEALSMINPDGAAVPELRIEIK